VSIANTEARLEARAYHPLIATSLGWFAWVAILLAIFGAGLWAYYLQIQQGLVVTGMRDTVTWGVYISNFVFFSGLSMAGTFISAILRITGARWRQPITRLAELTTVAALLMCATMPLIDMGRPDRLLNLIQYGRFESPLMWDITVIPTYLTASFVYLYIFLRPDVAVLRDWPAGRVSALRHRLYAVVAAKWHGTALERQRLKLAGTIMMLLVIPMGVATHSVVSWIFGMTLRSGWASTIFAPYFAVGALYSGTALLITLMIIFRQVYHLEEYFGEKQFRYLTYMLGAFGALYLYFTFADYLTTAYQLSSADSLLLQDLFFGRFAGLVWLGFIGGQLLPLLPVLHAKLRSIPVLFVASILVNVGMWIKRFVIVVPTLSLPQIPFDWGVYTPTPIELTITAASFAGFCLLVTLFAKFFPIISVWELEEEWEEEAAVEHVVPDRSATVDGAAAARPVAG
jgi:molybdopterin-containing oxidoreductase family membrane subunit